MTQKIWSPEYLFLARPALFRTAADKVLGMTLHDKQNRDAHTFTEMRENTLEAAWTVLNETTCSLLYIHIAVLYWVHVT